MSDSPAFGERIGVADGAMGLADFGLGGFGFGLDCWARPDLVVFAEGLGEANGAAGPIMPTSLEDAAVRAVAALGGPLRSTLGV